MKFIKFIFSSLFSNQKIIDESKKQPWWLAIVLVLISCIISVVPTFTSIMGMSGSAIITSSQNYNLDYSLKKFSQDYLNGDTCEITIKDEKLTATNFDFAEIKHGETITLLVKYVPFDASTDPIYDTFEEKVAATIKELKTSYDIPAGENDNPDTVLSNVYSTLILGSERVYLNVYSSGTTCEYKIAEDGLSKEIVNDATMVAQTSGTYKNIDGDLANISHYYAGDSNSASSEHAYSMWVEFFNESFIPDRNAQAFAATGMYLGINAVVLLISSLMIFFLSKSKTSIRKYKILESFKMICFASLCPALLSLLAGAIFQGFQQMAFMMFIVLRVTWLSMKATSPTQNQTIRK